MPNMSLRIVMAVSKVGICFVFINGSGIMKSFHTITNVYKVAERIPHLFCVDLGYKIIGSKT